jgi:hypothetical protein
LREKIKRLVSDDEAARAQALDELPALLAGLIEAAHLEVLQESLPPVIEDAAREQMEWGGLGKAPEMPPFEIKIRSPDNVMLEVASQTAVKQVLEAISAKGGKPDRDAPVLARSGIGAFFAQKYSVGRESLADIPVLVLAKVAAKGALALDASLINALGGERRLGGKQTLSGLLRLALRAVYSVITLGVALKSPLPIVLLILVNLFAGALAFFSMAQGHFQLPILFLGGIILEALALLVWDLSSRAWKRSPAWLGRSKAIATALVGILALAGLVWAYLGPVACALERMGLLSP